MQEFQAEEALPAGFTLIDQIRNFSPDKIRSAPPLNVIGIIKDQQAPMLTKGSDAKYTIEIIDYSTQGETYGLKVNIFWPMDKMPRSVKLADLVLIRKVKVQMFGGNVSLIASYATEFHLLASAAVPTSPASLTSAQWTSYPRSQKGTPSLVETRYGAWLHTKVADLDLPSDTEFEQRTIRSLNVKDKFSLLKDLKCENSAFIFVNLIGEIIKIHDSSFDYLTLYLTDYTANPKFYNYAWGGGCDATDDVQDEFGYLQMGRKKTNKNDWPGPFGRMTIQITAYDAQATEIRESIKTNQWVHLNNVQIKYGRMGGLLEGYLRDRDKICIRTLEPSQEISASSADSTDSRLQEAVKRKYAWSKKFQQQQKAILGEEEGLNSKRKRGSNDESSESKHLNSKQRRKQERAAAEQKVRELELKKLKLKNLNPNIKCAFPDQEPVTLKQILKPVNLDLDGVTVQCPFTNTKYRANIRIVDYFPPRIEDFAVGFRSSEFDMLSDYSGAEDSDAEISREIWHSGKGFSKDTWEWRFALQVEDADVDTTVSQDRMWLMVDNPAAQMLLNLPDDATSLRTHPALLSQVKEQLFKLWGDLEERKSASLPKSIPPAPSKTQSTAPIHSSSVPPSSPPARAMPADSDDENEISQESRVIQCGQRSQDSALEEKDSNVQNKIKENDDQRTVSNKGFTCCIQQYGVKVEEPDPRKANAGEGMRWQRMFGLFGTMID